MTRYAAMLVIAGLTLFGCANGEETTGKASQKLADCGSETNGNQSNEATLERELESLARIARLSAQEQTKARKVLVPIVRMRGSIAARTPADHREHELTRLRTQAERALAPIVPKEREPLLHEYVQQSALFSGV